MLWKESLDFCLANCRTHENFSLSNWVDMKRCIRNLYHRWVGMHLFDSINTYVWQGVFENPNEMTVGVPQGVLCCKSATGRIPGNPSQSIVLDGSAPRPSLWTLATYVWLGTPPLWKNIREAFVARFALPAATEGNCMMSDGTLWEVLTALYFRWTCLPDCAVPELDADYRRNNRRLS